MRGFIDLLSPTITRAGAPRCVTPMRRPAGAARPEGSALGAPAANRPHRRTFRTLPPRTLRALRRSYRAIRGIAGANRQALVSPISSSLYRRPPCAV